MDKGKLGWLVRFCSGFERAGSIFFVIFGIILGLDTLKPSIAKWQSPYIDAVKFIQDSSLWLVIGIVLMILVGMIAKRFRSNPMKESLKFIVDELQKAAYPDLQGDRNDDHRVTMFRHKRWQLIGRCVLGHRCWRSIFKGKHYPWSGWLVPVLRSGHRPLNTNAIFRAPAHGEKSEGVGGHAWDSGSELAVTDLPDLSKNISIAKKKKYASNTFCPVEIVDSYIGARKSLPRSIGAIPIYVRGKIWGVLVLDSQSPKGVTSEVLKNFVMTVKIIEKLLERTYE